jgi:predicted nucleic acid-binding protein
MIGRGEGMKDEVLVDTSIWIDYFKKKESKIYEQLTLFLREDQAVYTGIIATELFKVARGKKELSVLNTLFSNISLVKESEETYIKAGIMGYHLSQKGFNAGTVDLLISQIAIENNLMLFSNDQHFKKIAEIYPLKIFE